MAYMRGFCKNVHHDPLGELNLPRALVTEKAFPENEIVVSTAASASGAPTWTTDVIDERTIIDARTQLETDIPVNYADQNHNWTEGLGDITLGVKREIFSSLRTGSILSVQGGFLLPTGDSKRGFGAGTTQFEPFAAFDQLFRENTFLQFRGRRGPSVRHECGAAQHVLAIHGGTGYGSGPNAGATVFADGRSARYPGFQTGCEHRLGCAAGDADHDKPSTARSHGFWRARAVHEHG